MARLKRNLAAVASGFLAIAVFIGSLQANEIWPDREWAATEPAAVGMDQDLLAKARDYARTGGGSGSTAGVSGSSRGTSGSMAASPT